MIIAIMTLAGLTALLAVLYFAREFWVPEDWWDQWARWRVWRASRTPRL
ncbi:MAG: hypothetical protein K0Q71_2124 [Thermomicrobiales bacterium]|jgi:hypothetical protein|nr:hypothetical protein [Thermomicrobiales bacterium]